MFLRHVFKAFLLIAGTSTSFFAQKDFTKYVNPFIGTGGHGHTFPGATMPFGMVQVSPDTRTDDWDGCSGYHYSDTTIYGFSHTHLSGTGVPDYCDILLLPTLKNADFVTTKSAFLHKNEQASAGFYQVKMNNGITAELTATERVGIHRYSFPTANMRLIFNLKWRDKVAGSGLKIVAKNRVEGFRFSEGWAKNQKIYFVADFSEDIVGNELSVDDKVQPTQKSINATGKNIKAALSFAPNKQHKLVVKVAISAVSIENARENLNTEAPLWNFEKFKQTAKKAWNKELRQIEINDENQNNLTLFYTAFYHTKLQPNLFQDVNGDYRGLDGKVHRTTKNTNYTVFSLWDTFRAAHPLYSIIDKKKTTDFINTFIRQYEEGGRLPVWELAGNETDCMIGYHSVSVIADAMAKGIKGFDYEKAFAAAEHSATLAHLGLKAYQKQGFVGAEDDNESVSKTLEYAYDDYCIASMAKILGKKDDYELFTKRALSYKNLFDGQMKFMRPRQNGNFITPFKPNEVTFHFTEGNSWVYSFFVPQDLAGLMDLQGSKAAFTAKLDELFTTKEALTGREQPDITGLIGQYAHGNEPSHHIAYLYNYGGQPFKTQRLVRTILNDFYKTDPDGLIGNEDCGQMSAWFLLSSLGFYEVAPSAPQYDLGSPLFKQAKIHLENGKTIEIKTINNSKSAIYINAVKLNGKPYHATFLKHSDLENGAIIEIEMSDKPNETWFTTFSDTHIESNFAAVPIIDAPERMFKDSLKITLKTIEKNASILYSMDENEPNLLYTQPFTIDKISTIKALVLTNKGKKSDIATAKFLKLPHDWKVKLFSTYNRQYTGGGAIGLIDGLRGTTNFASSEWQGYQPEDFIAVIDLQKEIEINQLGGGFLQSARSWIWMPTQIDFETSLDNISFTPVATIKTDISIEEMESIIRDYKTKIKPTKARYVRIKAKNLGKIPAWHPGAGNDSFIFVDEIFIE